MRTMVAQDRVAMRVLVFAMTKGTLSEGWLARVGGQLNYLCFFSPTQFISPACMAMSKVFSEGGIGQLKPSE